jgi:hypothetical protein
MSLLDHYFFILLCCVQQDANIKKKKHYTPIRQRERFWHLFTYNFDSYFMHPSNITSTYQLTKLTTWSWALLEKPPIVQLLKNFQAFYGTRRFITMFTKAPPTGPYPQPHQSNPHHTILSLLRPILILPTHQHLRLASGLFPAGFPTNLVLWTIVRRKRKEFEGDWRHLELQNYHSNDSLSLNTLHKGRSHRSLSFQCIVYFLSILITYFDMWNIVHWVK